MIKTLLILLLLISTLVLLSTFVNKQEFSNVPLPNNVINHRNISWGKGWEDFRSLYGGSEFRFVFSNSRAISFRVESPNQDNDQGIQIKIDDKFYLLETPNIGDKTLSISVSEGIHTVRVRHFCAGSLSPCDVIIKSIEMDSRGKLQSKPDLPTKSFVILGDSITAGWGIYNFSYLALDSLNYQFRNAGIFGSTVSIVPGVDSGTLRYEKDIVLYDPGIIFVFLGTNDFAHKIPLNEFRKNYSQLIMGIKKGIPSAKVVAIGLLRRGDTDESTVRQYSLVIRDISILMNVKFIDPYDWLDEYDFTDAIHPSIVSQYKLADQLLKIIKEL